MTFDATGLNSEDIPELGELLAFLGDWLDGADSEALAASLRRFVASSVPRATTSTSCAKIWPASRSCSAPTTAPNS